MVSKVLRAALVTTCLAGALPAAAQTSAPTFADLTQPAADVTPQEAYVRALARQAYTWGWPMVNMLNRRAGITQAPHPGLLGGVVPVAPQGQLAMLHSYVDPSERAVACPNQDVVYGLGFFDLDSQPVVVQVPDFGDRFWVYAMYDQRTDQFGQLGKAYGAKPGFYLMAGPNWNGEVPEGIAGVVRSSTSLANIIPRIFLNDTDEDRTAIQPLIDQVVAYPLSEFDGKMKTIGWKDVPDIEAPSQGSQETAWVVPEKFFDQLGQVLDMVPQLPGEEAMYAQFRWLLDVATARSNIFENRPNETQYFYTDFDASGAPLDGKKTYAITFAAGEEPPVNGFWSLTLYNKEHFFHPNDLGRYSLGTKNTTLQRNADGSLTLYAGATSPGKDKESNWLPAPDEAFSLYIRAYWGKEPILDGSWTPPKIEVVQ